MGAWLRAEFDRPQPQLLSYSGNRERIASLLNAVAAPQGKYRDLEGRVKQPSLQLQRYQHR
ncbi:MAG: hypothetical protein AAGJ55_00200, partial [Cyanobacteria bacterium J06555_12]